MKKIITLTLAFGIFLAASSCTSSSSAPANKSMPGMSAAEHAKM
ncbi:hypothetical protein BH11VER1_BH11VER1_01160 [soil metagenome]